MTLAIDIGSNTIKCLLAKCVNGSVVKYYEKSLPNRIMSKKGGLVSNAADLIADSILYFQDKSMQIVDAFYTEIVATSALRDSEERDRIVRKVFKKTRCKIRILSGKEEATLSFSGAMCDNLIDHTKPCAYFDIGGGSVEVVVGKGDEVYKAFSLPLGAVRLTRDCANIDEYVKVSQISMKKHLVDLPDFEMLIGAGGAVVAARYMKQQLNLGGDNNTISLSDLKKCATAINLISIEERVAKYGIKPNRADILPAAFATIIELMEFLDVQEITHTYCNIRFGIILSKASL